MLYGIELLLFVFVLTPEFFIVVHSELAQSVANFAQ